ncbi:MAG: hypothetical protein KF718_01270 [Polyangiaceae bacterium]|nr:hypothetical protein [Polyangiaceae bacterium]
MSARYLPPLIRLGALATAGFVVMTACGGSEDGTSPAGGGGVGAQDGGGTGGISAGGWAGDSSTPCWEGAEEACYTGPPSTQGIGECKDGTTTCSKGVFGPCVGDVGPATEVCDDKDNNCNGIVDEGCACQTGESRPCYSGPSGTANEGKCKDGTQSCLNGTWASACVGEIVPESETCNGVDDDCDGQVDEGNPGGGSACPTGNPGVCAAGTMTCTGGSLQCAQNQSASTELCDNVDNDCDGQVDEGNPGGGGPCNTGQQGVCAAGTLQCAGGSLSCQATNAPSAEICNALDDDCDGQTDEGNPGGGGACVVPGKYGECAKGTWTCLNGSVQCPQSIQPTFEICWNGLDDDCNGLTDEWCCPYVFSGAEDGFSYETTVGGVALVGQPKHLDPSGPGKAIDFMPMWVRLDRARVTEGRVRAKILAAEDEIVYLDAAKLTVVEHAAAHEVFTSTSASRRSFEPAEGWDFIALPRANFRVAERASWQGHTDVTAEIGTLSDRAVTCDPTRDNQYELDFGAAQAGQPAWLVIEGWRLRFDRKLGANVPSAKPRLEVRQPDGSYREVCTLRAPRGDRKAVVFDLSGVTFPTGRYQVRVSTGTDQGGTGMWFIDRVRLNTGAAGELTRYDLTASQATLEHSGVPTVYTLGDVTRPRLARDDGGGEDSDAHATYGRFTRYGDVSELLGRSDDRLVVMRRGDGVVLQFDDVRAAPEGRERALFLYTDLVFKPRRVPLAPATELTTWVEPLPFHGMASYGAHLRHRQPDSAERRAYLAAYNTRELLPALEDASARALPAVRLRASRRRVVRFTTSCSHRAAPLSLSLASSRSFTAAATRSFRTQRRRRTSSRSAA